jgi:hypothetical protein
VKPRAAPGGTVQVLKKPPDASNIPALRSTAVDFVGRFRE